MYTNRQFHSIHGVKDLKDGLNETSVSQLVPDLRGIHPDDCYSVVPYEKGYTFLYYLEQQVGMPGDSYGYQYQHILPGLHFYGLLGL